MAVVQDKYPDNPPPRPPPQDEINREILKQIKEDRAEAQKQNAEIWKAIREVSQILSDVADRINGRKPRSTQP